MDRQAVIAILPLSNQKSFSSVGHLVTKEKMNLFCPLLALKIDRNMKKNDYVI